MTTAATTEAPKTASKTKAKKPAASKAIVLAALCAYAAYWNYQYIPRHAGYDEREEEIAILQSYPSVIGQWPPTYAVDYIDGLKPAKRRAATLVRVTLVLGNAFGVASYVAFVWGCYFSAKAMGVI